MVPPRPASAQQRSSRLRSFAQTLLRCLPFLIVSVFSTTPAITLGQGVRPHAMMTEIWMTGSGVALSRRVPRDRTLIHPDENDQFAQSMLKIAQQRRDQGDQESAEWLARCAQNMTNGRIGSEWSVDIHHDDFASGTRASVASVTTFPEPLPGEPVWFPLHSKAHTPVSLAPIPKNELTAGGTREPDLHGVPSQNSKGEFRPEGEVPAETLVGERQGNNSARLTHQPDLDSATVPSVTEDEADAASSGQTKPRPRAATPHESTSGPVTIGLISFAAGAVFCVSLCAMMRLVPSRPTLAGPVELPSQTEQEAPEPTIQPTAEKQDNRSWVIEEFYSDNVELYGQLAQSG